MPTEIVKKVIEAGLNLMSPEAKRDALVELADGDTDKLARFIDHMTAAVGVSIMEFDIPQIDDILSSIRGAEAAADPKIVQHIKELAKESAA